MKKPLKKEISLRKNPPKVSHFIISKNFVLRKIKKKNSKVNQLKNKNKKNVWKLLAKWFCTNLDFWWFFFAKCPFLTFCCGVWSVFFGSLPSHGSSVISVADTKRKSTQPWSADPSSSWGCVAPRVGAPWRTWFSGLVTLIYQAMFISPTWKKHGKTMFETTETETNLLLRIYTHLLSGCSPSKSLSKSPNEVALKTKTYKKKTINQCDSKAWNPTVDGREPQQPPEIYENP